MTGPRPAVPDEAGIRSGPREPGPAWVTTRALGRAVLLAGALLLVAVLAHRVDLVPVSYTHLTLPTKRIV